jgi:O-antigen/teichoic acid export membrane protein
MAWGQAGKLLEVALTMVVAIIVVRALEPKGFGTYALLTNLAGAASVFIPVIGTEALGAVLPRFGDRRQRVWLVGLIALLRLAVIAVIAAVVVSTWNSVGHGLGLGHVSVRVLVVGVLYWIAQDVLNTVAGLYLSEMHIRPVALWRTAGQAFTLVGVSVAAVTGHATVGVVLVVVSLGYAIAAAALAVGVVRTGARAVPRERVRFVLGFTRHVWVIGVVSFALATQVDILLIGALTGSAAEVAFYVAAVGVIGRAQIVFVGGWGSLIIPTLGAALQSRGKVGLARAARLFAELLVLVTLPLNALVLATAYPLVHVLFGASYDRAAHLLVVFTATTALAVPAVSAAAVSALWALDRQQLLARVRIVFAVVNIALAVILIPRHGAMGAVIATGAAAVVSSLVELALALRDGALEYPLAVLLRAAPAAVLAGAVAWAAPDDGLGLAVALVGGLAAYLAALVVLRPLTSEHLEVLGRISPRLAVSPLRLLARA